MEEIAVTSSGDLAVAHYTLSLQWKDKDGVHKPTYSAQTTDAVGTPGTSDRYL
jgi:hypothetical protein